MINSGIKVYSEIGNYFLNNLIFRMSTLALWVECSPMARETGIQSLVESYQRLKKWFLIPPYLTLSIIRYVSRLKWSNPEKGVTPSPTTQCGSYWKRVALDNFTYLVQRLVFWYWFTWIKSLILGECANILALCQAKLSLVNNYNTYFE